MPKIPVLSAKDAIKILKQAKIKREDFLSKLK